jgi:hypothetical protein
MYQARRLLHDVSHLTSCLLHALAVIWCQWLYQHPFELATYIPQDPLLGLVHKVECVGAAIPGQEFKEH